MIAVIVNGQRRNFGESTTVDALVASLPVKERQVAVARNGEVLPHRNWPETLLVSGDVIELVRMVGGGSSYAEG